LFGFHINSLNRPSALVAVASSDGLKKLASLSSLRISLFYASADFSADESAEVYLSSNR